MRTILGLSLIMLTILVIIWTQQRRLMYFPFGQVPDPLSMGLKGATAVTFDIERRPHAHRLVH